MTPAAEWQRAELALTLLAINPGALGGLWLRARAGPVRERFLAGFGLLPWPIVKLTPSIGDDALFGGIDLAATLAEGQLRRSAALLATRRFAMLAMAERCPVGLAVRLGRWLDDGQSALIALDEAADADELPPIALTERLGLFVDLDTVRWSGSADISPKAEWIKQAMDRLANVVLPETAVSLLVTTAAKLGIGSLRVPMQAIACAMAHAAWRGAGIVEQADLQIAVELTMSHRAIEFPTEEDTAEPPPEQPSPQETDSRTQADPQDTDLPEEILLDAARAALPQAVLDNLKAGRAAKSLKGSGAGTRRKGNRRGRPLPSREGPFDATKRIDPVATLRAAAPWQTIRRAAQPDREGLLIRVSDFRLKRYQEQSDRVVIFAVDASGSAALARLAEAKGAVELLLAQAYSRRDHVALIAFRGSTAELLLPPTRSLVQTKRRLAALPGGGGTPLAAGLKLAAEVATLARGRGMTPVVALLTDGRANIALDGTGNRTLAMSQAAQMSRSLAANGIAMIVIDTGSRPQPELQKLAAQAAGTYLALPRADAARMSAALSTALDA